MRRHFSFSSVLQIIERTICQCVIFEAIVQYLLSIVNQGEISLVIAVEWFTKCIQKKEDLQWRLAFEWKGNSGLVSK